MKRILAVCMTTILIISIILVMTVCLAYADAYQIADQVQIPDQIQSWLEKEKLDNYTATSCVTDVGKSSDYAFVLMQGNKGNNILYVFRQKSSGWTFQYKTNAGVPQGTGRVTVRQEGASTNGIYIAEENDSGEYWIEYAIYRAQDSSAGAWRLREYSDHDRKMNVKISDNRIAYYIGSDLDVLEGYAYGTIQDDLRYVNLNNIPSTLKEAKNKYTLAPSIPAGLLTAKVIKFTGGKKYPVYSAPSENSMRGANGKASVSTNDWIQVFGRENGWIMIQYAIDASHYRIGWITEKALPKNSSVDTVDFMYSDTIVISDANLTDDPLFSESVVCTIPAGNTVQYLSTMGEWVYIEWNGASQPVRGFIRLNCVTRMTKDQAKSAAIDILLATNPTVEQQPVTREMLESYSVTFDFDPYTNQWTVGFDSGRDYRYTIVVNDQTGNGWAGSENG